MRDWNGLLRERLRRLDFAEDEREEVIAELASHLEESYEAIRQQGSSDAAAAARATSELGDIELLVLNIVRAKQEGQVMSDRLRKLWLPGLVALGGFNLLWMAIMRAGMAPRLLDFGVIIVPVYFPLLLAMPLFGALGAYLSYRAGGSRGARFAAGLLPLLAIPLAVLTAVGASMVFNLNLTPTAHAAPGIFPTKLAVAVVALSGFAIQTAALLLGALPFLNAEKSGQPTE